MSKFIEKCENIAKSLGLEMESYEDGVSSGIFEDDGILHCTQGKIRVAFFLDQSRGVWSRTMEKLIRDELKKEVSTTFSRNRINCKNINWNCATLEEANLADAIVAQGRINGVDENALRYVFVMTLRMLKSESDWSK